MALCLSKISWPLAGVCNKFLFMEKSLLVMVFGLYELLKEAKRGFLNMNIVVLYVFDCVFGCFLTPF